MPIEIDDIKVFRGAKRDQTETAGGLPSGVVVEDGVVNNMFSNISRLDRVRGSISIEKAFVGVTSADASVYSGCLVAVCDPPFDENVNVMLVKPTYPSVRSDIVDQLEAYFQLGQEAGNAKLAYTYQAGAEKIMYLIRHYEYSPEYADDGSMRMSTKFDLRHTLNISIGEILWIGNAASGNGEYIEVKSIETLSESMPDPDKDHYYNKIYLAVQLASPLDYTHTNEDVTKRTDFNTAWQAYGCMRLKQPLLSDDTFVTVEDMTGRLIPVIEKNILSTDQVVYQEPVLQNDLVVSYGGQEITLSQVEQKEMSEVVLISGTSVNHTFKYGPVKPVGVVFRYRYQKRWVMVESDAEGLFSGYATGVVAESGGAMSLNLAMAPDIGTVGIVSYQTQHQYEVCSSPDLLSSNIVGTSQTETRNIAAGITSYSVTLASTIPCRMVAGKLRIYALVGGKYELVAQDDLFGVLGGSLSGTVSYATKYVNITSFGPVVTRNLKFEFEVTLFRKRLFTEADFTVSSDGLTYTLNVGSAIVWPADNTSMVSTMAITFDTMSAPVATPVAGMYVLNFATYATGGYEIGTMSGSRSIPLAVTINGYIQKVALASSPLVDYANGTITFVMDAGSLAPIGVSPDAAIKSIAVSAIVTDAASFGNELPLPLHFNKTGLVPGGITGVIVSPLGVLNFYDNKQGVLKLVKTGLIGSPETIVTDLPPCALDSIASTPLGLMMAVHTSSNNRVYASLNNGSSWVQLLSGSSEGFPGYGSIDGHGNFYAVGTNSRVYYSSSLSGSWAYAVISMAYVYGMAFGNGVAVFAGSNNPQPMLVVNSDGFTTGGTQIPDTTGFGRASKIAFGKDAVGAGRFVCVSTTGKVWYGAGAPDGTGWAYSILPWVDEISYLEFSDGGGSGIWVCAGKNKHIAWSKDGVIWSDVSTAFMDAADTAIYGLSVSTDGLFMLSGTVNKYSTRDMFTWTMESSHPMITYDGQYKIIFNADTWVELWSDPSSSVVSVVKQSQAAPLTFTDIGTVDYDAGEGELTKIEDIFSVSSTMYLSERTISEFAVHTRGADPVTPGSFALSCFATSRRAITCIGNDDTGEITGDATGVYNPTDGYAYGEWLEPIIPETTLMSYGFSSMYHPNFEGVNEKAFPLNGRVPLIKKDSIAIIMDKRNYQLSVALGSDLDDLLIELVDISGWPPVLPDPCVVKIGDEEILIESVTDNILTVSSSGRGHNSTTISTHAPKSVVTLITYNMEWSPVESVNAGTIGLAGNVLNKYSKGAILSSAIEIGDLSVSHTAYHTQIGWDGDTWCTEDEWAETLGPYYGDSAGGTYNFTDYPLSLVNIGSVTERWMIEITSTSPLKGSVRGEYLGVIASDTSLESNVSPINPNVNAPYFVLSYQGFGSGWQVGNLLRFDTRGAIGPFAAIRVVDAQASSATDDGAEIIVCGDIPVA